MKLPLVNYDTAYLAYVKGFDWPCEYAYDNQETTAHAMDYTGAITFDLEDIKNAHSNGHPKVCLAPTKELLRLWLAKVCDVHLFVMPVYMGENTTPAGYYYQVNLLNLQEGFHDAETALNAGLIAALTKLP